MSKELRRLDRRSGLLVNCFFVFVFLVVPLSFHPSVFAGDAGGLQLTSGFRAALLAASVCVGLAVFLAVSSMQLRDLGRVIRGEWSVLLLGGLIVWLLVSLAVPGLGPWDRALGEPSRFDGALVQAGWFMLGLLSFAIVRGSLVPVTVLTKWLMASAIVTSVWSFAQGVGLDPLTWMTGVFLDIPAGAFGHGGLATMFIATGVLVLGAIWAGLEKPRNLHFLAFVVFGLGLGATAGRAALLGLVVAGFVLVILNRRDTRAVGRLAVYGALTVVGVVIAFTLVGRTQSQLQNSLSALSGGDLSLNARFAAWKGGLRLLGEHPLFGVGAAGFEYGVWSVLEGDEAATMIRDPLASRVEGLSLEPDSYTIVNGVIALVDSRGEIFVDRLGWDKAHSYYIDIGLAAGIPALILFVAFALAAVFALLRDDSPFSRGMTAVLIALGVFGIAWFGTITLDPVIWTLVGGALGSIRTATVVPVMPKGSR